MKDVHIIGKSLSRRQLPISNETGIDDNDSCLRVKRSNNETGKKKKCHFFIGTTEFSPLCVHF